MASSEPPDLPGVEHLYVRANGVRQHVAVAGAPDAPAIVLVHGWPQNWWCWRGVIPVLAERFRVVAPDLRGHGWSEAPAEGYEKARLAQDVLALADELEIERFGWVGHDWGAVAGFFAAVDAPERLHGLIAMSVPHPWPAARDRLNPVRLLVLSYQLPLSLPWVGERLIRAGLAGRMLRSGISSRVPDSELEPYVSTVRRPEAARATTQIYRTFLTRELASLPRHFAQKRLAVPTRLIVGSRDPIVFGASLRGFEAYADDMTVEWVPDVGHFLPDDRPGLVADRAIELFAPRASAVA
jgi:pimeloyl-ACP methyl ester carboxylesterase